MEDLLHSEGCVAVAEVVVEAYELVPPLSDVTQRESGHGSGRGDKGDV